MRDGVIKHVSYFNVAATTKELDKKFADLLGLAPLETDDRLCIEVGWKGQSESLIADCPSTNSSGCVDVRRLFVAPVETTISDLLDTCWPNDECTSIRFVLVDGD